MQKDDDIAVEELDIDTASDATCSDMGITDNNWWEYNKKKTEAKNLNQTERKNNSKIKEVPKKFI